MFTRKLILNKPIDGDLAGILAKEFTWECFLINMLFYILFMYGFQQSPSVCGLSIQYSKIIISIILLYITLNSQLIYVTDKVNKQIAWVS